MSYAEIEKRVNLSMEHFGKPCLRGDCERDGEVVVHCERHQDTSAIVRRYLRLLKYKETTPEERIEQSMGTYRHADRTEWRGKCH